MPYRVRFALVIGLLSLGACRESADDASPALEQNPRATVANPTGVAPTDSAPEPVPAASSQLDASNPSKAARLAGQNDDYPDLTPAPLTPEAQRTTKGAMAVALPWARGIELREFDQSWNLLGPEAKESWSKADFNAQFQSLTDLFVTFGPGRMEGAAGSQFYTLPVSITGQTSKKAARTLRGELVLRRVNDVPGATPDQLNWHAAKLSLDGA